jgi:hypothetical protein
MPGQALQARGLDKLHAARRMYDLNHPKAQENSMQPYVDSHSKKTSFMWYNWLQLAC